MLTYRRTYLPRPIIGQVVRGTVQAVNEAGGSADASRLEAWTLSAALLSRVLHRLFQLDARYYEVLFCARLSFASPRLSPGVSRGFESRGGRIDVIHAVDLSCSFQGFSFFREFRLVPGRGGGSRLHFGWRVIEQSDTGSEW